MHENKSGIWESHSREFILLLEGSLRENVSIDGFGLFLPKISENLLKKHTHF